MKVIINFPDTCEGVSELEERTAIFHATLIAITIDKQDLDTDLKEKLLDSITDSSFLEATA